MLLSLQWHMPKSMYSQRKILLNGPDNPAVSSPMSELFVFVFNIRFAVMENK